MTTTSVVIKLFLDILAFCSIISNMFNLFPKKKSVDEIIEDVNTTCSGWTWILEDSAKKDAVIKNLREQQEFLYKENEELKKILENIEEDGTYEHNNAIKIKEENVKLKLEIEKWEKDWDYQNENIKNLIAQKDELVKEVLGLRHLKEENVQLMERVNEIDSDMNKEYQAEIFTLRNDIAVLKARNAELLKNNNRLTVDYNGVLHNGGLKYMEAKYQILEHNYQGCTKYRDEYKHQLNAANKEIEALKKEKKESFNILKKAIEDESNRFHKLVVEDLNLYNENKNLKTEIKKLKEDIIDYVIEKDDKIQELEKVQKHPMYPIHWGGYDGEPKEKEFSANELLKRVTEYADTLDEQCDEVKKSQNWSTFKVAINDAVQEKQREVYGDCYDKTEKYKPWVEEPIDWKGDKTAAENLEEKFVKGEDVLDYFEKPWQCPCSMCKHAREESQDKSWEEAASDLALRVIKLEKQIEELKIDKNLTNQ